MDTRVLRALAGGKQAAGKTSRIRTEGFSMQPTLREGDGLTVRHLNPQDLRIGDLGVFWTGEILLAHRVIRIQWQEGKYGFLLKGDSCLDTHSLSEDHLLGKVVEVHREDQKLCLESPSWQRINQNIGRFLGQSHAWAQALEKAERRVLGDRERPIRLAPSRMFFSGCTWMQRLFVGFLYLFQMRGTLFGRRIFRRPPEDRLLLDCTVAAVQDRAVSEAQRSYPLFNWSRFSEKASLQGIAPLIYWSLKKAGTQDRVPEDVLGRLERSYYATTTSNLKLFAQLRAILEGFEKAGMRALVLKGPVLAAVAYPNMGVRPIGDLDLLIHPDDFPKARAVFSELDYRLAPSTPPLEGTEWVEYAHYFSQVRFWGRDQTVVETHFSLLNLGVPREDTHLIWQRSCGFEGVGFKGQRASFEDMLIHLCLHAAQHNFCKLLYFCDIASLLQGHGPSLDWAYLIQAAEKRGMRPLLYHNLSLCRELLEVGAPPEVLKELRPGPLRRRVFAVLWGHRRILALQKKKRSAAAEAVLCSIAEMDSLFFKLLYLFRVCFPRRKWLSAYFSRPVTPAGYLRDLPRYLLGNLFGAGEGKGGR